MPTSIVIRLIERLAIVETKVESLMRYQKWQVGMLGAIFLAVLGAWVTR